MALLYTHNVQFKTEYFSYNKPRGIYSKLVYHWTLQKLVYRHADIQSTLQVSQTLVKMSTVHYTSIKSVYAG